MAAACLCPCGQQPIFPPLNLNPVPNYMRVIRGIHYLLSPISTKEKSDARKNRTKQKQKNTSPDHPFAAPTPSSPPGPAQTLPRPPPLPSPPGQSWSLPRKLFSPCWGEGGDLHPLAAWWAVLLAVRGLARAPWCPP